MRPVSTGLANAPVEDVEAIAEYLLSLKSETPATPTPTPTPAAEPANVAMDTDAGARVFEGACAGCHGPGAPMRIVDARPALDQTSALHAQSPRNFLKTVLEGVPIVPGKAGPAMPPFADSLDNGQIVALAAFLREHATPGRPWSDAPAILQDLRQEAK
jgi:mono/diheme cytochrome c family protein